MPQLGKDLLPPSRHLHPAAPLLLAAPPTNSDIKKAEDPLEDTYSLSIWLGTELKHSGDGRSSALVELNQSLALTRSCAGCAVAPSPYCVTRAAFSFCLGF